MKTVYELKDWLMSSNVNSTRQKPIIIVKSSKNISTLPVFQNQYFYYQKLRDE